MNIIKYLLELTNTPWINLLFLILAIVGPLLAVVFYLKGKKERRPVFAVRTLRLVEDKIEKIHNILITYRGSKIDNLSISKLALWNRGKETISRSDIAPSNPIRMITSDSVDLLEVQIIHMKNNANNFSLRPIPTNNNQDLQNELLIDFDYFDLNEGVVFQIFHTGKSSDDIRIIGAVKGVGEIQKIPDPFFYKFLKPFNIFNKIKRRHRKLVLAFLLIITPILVIITETLPKPEPNNNTTIKYILLLLMGLLYWSTAFSVLRRKMPKSLEIFEDEIKP